MKELSSNKISYNWNGVKVVTDDDNKSSFKRNLKIKIRR